MLHCDMESIRNLVNKQHYECLKCISVSTTTTTTTTITTTKTVEKQQQQQKWTEWRYCSAVSNILTFLWHILNRHTKIVYLQIFILLQWISKKLPYMVNLLEKRQEVIALQCV